MKGRMTIIAIALVMALVAVAGVATYVTGIQRQVNEGSKSVGIVVAEKDISPGTTGDSIIKDGMVTIKMVPKRLVAEGALTSTSAIEGKTVKVAIGKGEQITNTKLDSSLRTAALTVRVSGDMRAISIPVDEINGVAGALTAGDKVDVTATFDKETTGTDVTMTILRDIEVLEVSWSSPPKTSQSNSGVALASDNTSQTSSSVKKTVTLSVNVADVEKLVFAERKGTVWLSLVPTKSKTSPTAGQTASTVLAK